jgi:FKBP-type peptidyl-prolyl cis-trans isomerase FklB
VCVCVCVSVMMRKFVDVLYGASIHMCVCMAQGKMNRVFNDVVFITGRVGKIEGPIMTDFGYHLILIIRRGDETLQDALRQTSIDAARKAGDGEGVGGFLAENEGKPGVVTLPSGLQYKVLRDGAGMQHPREDTPCECHYEGQLLDGAVFDSSYARGGPSTFAPNQVIKGWTEAMQLMVEGDKWEMYIPHQLAYGERGSPPSIPPAALLIFVMELVKICGPTVAKRKPLASGAGAGPSSLEVGRLSHRRPPAVQEHRAREAFNRGRKADPNETEGDFKWQEHQQKLTEQEVTDANAGAAAAAASRASAAAAAREGAAAAAGESAAAAASRTSSYLQAIDIRATTVPELDVCIATMVKHRYNAQHSDELSLARGQVLRVFAAPVEPGWYLADKDGERGLVPCTHICMDSTAWLDALASIAD